MKVKSAAHSQKPINGKYTTAIPSPPPSPPPPNPGLKYVNGVSHSLESETEEHPSKTTIMIGSCNEKDYHNKQQILRKAKKRKSQDFIVPS